MVSDHDRRQLALIDHVVSRFQQGEVPISDTISSVEALIDLLEEIEEGAIGQFSNAWATLEECYAVGLHAQDPTLYASDQPDIQQACASLRGLVSTLLSP